VSPNEHRWVGVGRSGASNSHIAGAEAAAAAVAERPEPRLLIVFASAAHDLRALLAGIDAGGVPVVGCSTAGEIASDGPGDGGVVVMALGGEGFAVETAVARDVPGRLREAGAEVARCCCSPTASPATSRTSSAAPTTSPARRSRWSAAAPATTSR
jgi:hypothetical protein